MRRPILIAEASITREHLRIVAVIQARMGSTRLPGKVLRPIAGKPLLWHIVHRLKSCKLVEEIAIATSVNPRDDAIVEFAATEGVAVVRGSEDNVLARFARAAESLDADIIVRVSSDAPFIDAGFVDHLVATLIEQGGDYVLMEEGAPCAHEGVDPFTRRALDKLMMDASDDASAREHVTDYFKLHPDFVRIARAASYPALAREAGRLTIDTEEDLTFVEAVHGRMGARAGEASLGDLLLLLEREPALRAVNAHVRQKPIAARPTRLALIACDGGGKFGYGHVKCMLALARELRDREHIGAIFCVNGTDDARAVIAKAGFETADGTLAALVERHRPHLLVLDGREGPSRGELAAMSRSVQAVAVIDDGSERRLAATRAYYPSVPQAMRLDWRGAQTQVRIGWEWVPLGLQQTGSQPFGATTLRGSRPTLLVAIGGSDLTGLALRAARALAPLGAVLRVRFVIGTGQKDAKRTAAAIVACKRDFETIEGTDDLSTEYASADLALCVFGVMAYELAAFGVPALYLNLTPDHATSASAFEAAGMGISLGLADEISDEAMVAAVRDLLGDAPRRRAMRAAALMTIDANGAARIAADLADALAEPGALVKSAL